MIYDIYRLNHPESYQSTTLHTSLGLYVVIRILLLLALKHTTPHLTYDDEVVKMTISIVLMDAVLIWKSCLWENDPVIVYVRKTGNLVKQDKAVVDAPGITTTVGEGEAVPCKVGNNVEALKLDKRRKNVCFNL